LPNRPIFLLTIFQRVLYTAVIMSKRQVKQYPSIAAFAADKALRNIDLARLLGVDAPRASKLRTGKKKYRSLIEPLRIAKICNVPIENLAPKSAA
jgi:DNA-binding Xre family transcriptional regulator